MVEKKQWQPGSVVVGMVVATLVGVLMMMTGVFVVPGVFFVAYGLLFPLIEGWDHVWNTVERFVDWWGEGR